MSSLAECIGKLRGADEIERAYAAEDLGYLNAAAGVPALLERLGVEPSSAVRDAIFQALIRIDGDAPMEACVRLLGSEEAQIRNQAVDALRRKGARSIPFLEAAMRDGDKDVRKLVLDVLSGIQACDAGPIYALALSDTDPNVVITAVENLGRIRAVEFLSRIEDLLQPGSHPMLVAACVEALVGIGRESSLAAIRRCFPELATVPDFFLGSCLKAIAVFGGAGDFAEVAGLLPVRGPHLRPAILSALLATLARCPPPVPGETTLAALRAVVEDGGPPLVRYQAARSLGFWTAREDVCAFLISCLSSPERLVRLGAAECLRMAGGPEVEPVIAARALEESDEEVLQALGC
jgi:HEAT repeat protein